MSRWRISWRSACVTISAASPSARRRNCASWCSVTRANTWTARARATFATRFGRTAEGTRRLIAARRRARSSAANFAAWRRPTRWNWAWTWVTSTRRFTSDFQGPSPVSRNRRVARDVEVVERWVCTSRSTRRWTNGFFASRNDSSGNRRNARRLIRTRARVLAAHAACAAHEIPLDPRLQGEDARTYFGAALPEACAGLIRARRLGRDPTVSRDADERLRWIGSSVKTSGDPARGVSIRTVEEERYVVKLAEGGARSWRRSRRPRRSGPCIPARCT